MGTTPAMGELWIGTSGWKYAAWRGDFYPEGLVQRRELDYLASRLDAVEFNGSFYSLQRPTTYQRIVDETPNDFRVAVKGSRFITHMRRLGDVQAGLANFLASGVLALGDRLGPLLWQLPGNLAFDEGVVAGFLEQLPTTTAEAARLGRRHADKVSGDRAWTEVDTDRPLRHVVEARHESFVEPAALRLLADHDVALAVSDSPGDWPCFEEVTTDLVYVRLHGHTELYASGYSSRSLDSWAAKCRDWLDRGADVHVYFDNDARGRAPHDAVALRSRLAP